MQEAQKTTFQPEGTRTKANIPIFCAFERSFDRHPIEVNVTRICYIEGNDCDSSTLYFDVEHFVVVHGKPEQIRAQIETRVSQLLNLRTPQASDLA
ncbi:hypothetical protein C5L14_00770 [Labrys okinawensis]|uniref:Uncharacterized protein n=1 Tax=Labrys okinawensis TaxID=346911 RepID=A0A2S9QIH4_9HYPH|nr:hypothetical protein [Labrys okinawensis]PRH89159.1 hypothetical protein C5L14_00770 [Labrys okinawensis]